MKTSLMTLAVSASMIAGAAEAQAGVSLDDFVRRANRIPMNPTAMLRPDAHRLKGEAERALTAVNREVREARAAGRTPPACPGESISVSPNQLLAFLNGIPQTRRQRMSVVDGFRAWMADRYPCPRQA
ncbi:hypothetical protein ACIQC9_03650 [Brevundimonas sp. NPDC092305]|uniref:hypothetical protein n=1 Tax=Brevundimonas sp. NPDC092305 TaxID=3363957 RepID=UPI0038104EEF